MSKKSIYFEKSYNSSKILVPSFRDIFTNNNNLDDNNKDNNNSNSQVSYNDSNIKQENENNNNEEPPLLDKNNNGNSSDNNNNIQEMIQVPNFSVIINKNSKSINNNNSIVSNKDINDENNKSNDKKMSLCEEEDNHNINNETNNNNNDGKKSEIFVPGFSTIIQSGYPLQNSDKKENVNKEDNMADINIKNSSITFFNKISQIANDGNMNEKEKIVKQSLISIPDIKKSESNEQNIYQKKSEEKMNNAEENKEKILNLLNPNKTGSESSNNSNNISQKKNLKFNINSSLLRLIEKDSNDFSHKSDKQTPKIHEHCLYKCLLLDNICSICSSRTISETGYKCDNYQECPFNICEVCFEAINSLKESNDKHIHPLISVIKDNFACNICQKSSQNNIYLYCNMCNYGICPQCYLPNN